jgi:hypothetical protein
VSSRLSPHYDARQQEEGTAWRCSGAKYDYISLISEIAIKRRSLAKGLREPDQSVLLVPERVNLA